MKRFISLLLVGVLLFTTFSFSASASWNLNWNWWKKSDPAPEPYERIDTDYPFIMVRGMDFGGLMIDPESEDATAVVGKPDVKRTISSVMQAIFRGILRRDWNRLADEVIEIVDDIMGKMMLTKDGEPQFNTGVPQYPLSLANYPEYVETLGNGVEEGYIKRAVETYGAEKVYYYNYDWRIDPFIHAQRLNDLIETAKKDNNAEQVNLVCCSMGGILTISYLYQYGASSVHRVEFISSTFCGTYVTGDLLNGRVKVYGDLLYEFIITRMGVSKTTAFFLKIAYKMGLFKLVERLADELVPEIKDHVFDVYMRDMFGTMPVVWALTQPEDVDSGLEYIFHGKEDQYKKVIDLAKQYKIMNMQRNDMLKKMQKNGLGIIICASYELPVVPVYEHGNVQGDTVLESALMLGGATMSLLHETLPKDYKPLDKRFFSPDREIDLSTAVLPEYTWALKNVSHVFTSYGTDCQDMLMWMLNEETCPTVFTNEKYPQFLLSNGAQELEPLQ